MVMLTRKQVILAKLETTYGEDPTPTAGANAILALNPSIKEVRAPIERAINLSTLSNKPSLKGEENYEINFQVEIKGSGTAGTAPRLGALLQACSMSETIISSTSVTYEPASSSQKSVTLWAYVDGRKYVINGARGTFKATLTAGQLPIIDFTFTGKFTAPTLSAIVTGTYDTPDPVACKNCTFSYNGKTTLICSSIEVDMANSVVKRQDLSDSTGIAGFEITSRKPMATLSVEEQIETSYDFRGDQLVTAREISVEVGETAGNICTIEAPKYNITTIERSDADGVSIEKLVGECSVDSGDDELTITMT